MDEMHFLNGPLSYCKLPTDPQTLIGNRFRSLYQENYFRDESRFGVLDVACNDKHLLTTIGKSVDGGQRARNFCRVLEEFKNVAGFPRLLTTIDLNRYMGIVTSGLDEHLHRVLLRSTSKITHENGVRLCYRIFNLLEQLHERGYVHRHVDVNTIRAGIDWSGDFAVELHGFAYSVPINPPPSSVGMSGWFYQSHYVNSGQPYNVMDDFISGLYVVMESQGIPPFRHTSHMSSLEQKLEFEDHPLFFLGPGLNWIAELYEELTVQRRTGYNKDAIQTILDEAVPGVNPASPFKWKDVASRDQSGKIIPKLATDALSPPEVDNEVE